MTALARDWLADRRAYRTPKHTIFKARAEARATLWQAYEFDLHVAVDALMSNAIATGLEREIGCDAVQQIMAHAFESVRRGV